MADATEAVYGKSSGVAELLDYHPATSRVSRDPELSSNMI